MRLVLKTFTSVTCWLFFLRQPLPAPAFPSGPFSDLGHRGSWRAQSKPQLMWLKQMEWMMEESGGGGGGGTDKGRDEWVKGVEEVIALHYALLGHHPGWLVLWAGVKGATPASHSVVMGLLPWQQQSSSLANITRAPDREGRAGCWFDGQHTSNNRFTWNKKGEAWEDGLVPVHKKSFEFILESVLLVDNQPLYIYEPSCTTRPDCLRIYYLCRLWFWNKIASNYSTSNILGEYICRCKERGEKH